MRIDPIAIYSLCGRPSSLLSNSANFRVSKEYSKVQQNIFIDDDEEASKFIASTIKISLNWQHLDVVVLGTGDDDVLVSAQLADCQTHDCRLMPTTQLPCHRKPTSTHSISVCVTNISVRIVSL